MAFSNKALATLEFDKIKEMLAASCATDGEHFFNFIKFKRCERFIGKCHSAILSF